MRNIGGTLLLAVIVAVMAGFLWHRQDADSTALRRVQRECEVLRRELTERDRVVADLRVSIERLEQAALASRSTETNRPPEPTAAEAEVARRVADLATVNSNTVALVAKLVRRNAEADRRSETPQQRASGIKALESALAEQRKKVDALKQKTAELLVDLKVPEEISTMDSSKALDTARLKAYWPFFEAKRERDSMQLILDQLRMRLAQEQIDAGPQDQKATER
jgi:hypothetical protein